MTTLRPQLEELIAQYSVHALKGEREPFMDRIMELVEGERLQAKQEACDEMNEHLRTMCYLRTETRP